MEMKEIILSKAIMHDRDIEDVVIKINDEIPGILEMAELYDSSVFFKEQATKLADALYSALPVATLKELIITLTKRMYDM